MTCKHLWLKLAGGMYRWKPTEICSRCGITKPVDKPVCTHEIEWQGEQRSFSDVHLDGTPIAYCPLCGEKL